MKTLPIFKLLLLVNIILFCSSFSVFGADTYVMDFSNKLSEAEKAILEKRCEWFEEELGIDLFISIEGGSTESSSNNISLNENDEGLLLYIDSDNNYVNLIPYGSLANQFSEDICGEINYIANEHIEEMSIFKGCQSAIINIENIISSCELVNNKLGYMPSVIDNADILSESEEEELIAMLDGIREQYKMDVAVFTDPIMSGDTVTEAADDIFDYYFYGIGKGDDGILLYISQDPREYWFTTHGHGVVVFNDENLRYMDDMVLSYLKNNNYYGAVKEFAEISQMLLSDKNHTLDSVRLSAGDYDTSLYSEEISSDGDLSNIIMLSIIIIPFILAVILTLIKLFSMNTAVSQKNAHNYIQENSFKIKESNDLLLHSVVTKTEKPKETISSSTTHTSSSGRSHGGSGGKY